MKNAERQSSNEKDSKAKDEQDRELSQALEATFPASDPPASAQPGSGTTGPEVAKAK